MVKRNRANHPYDLPQSIMPAPPLADDISDDDDMPELEDTEDIPEGEPPRKRALSAKAMKLIEQQRKYKLEEEAKQIERERDNVQAGSYGPILWFDSKKSRGMRPVCFDRKMFVHLGQFQKMQTEGHWKRNPKDSCSLEFPQLAEMTELFGTLSDSACAIAKLEEKKRELRLEKMQERHRDAIDEAGNGYYRSKYTI